MLDKPAIRTKNPNFSCGPCTKRPGWSLENLSGVPAGRSHRASGPKGKLKDVIENHRALLGIPADYKIGIMPASDTGAFEAAMWSMLGARPVDVLAWESFSCDWLVDITEHLKLDDVKQHHTDFGVLPDLSKVREHSDIVFAWNGTTSGVCVPNGDWIADDREGLIFCDATSAVFAYDMPWDKLDITTWSWQKVLGSEAAHGMLVLSPRAVERLESYTPPWPLPKIFRLTNNGKLINGIFEGATINTPSMLAVEDVLDSLGWINNIGGLRTTMARAQENAKVIDNFVAKHEWIEYLAADEASRSITSICLNIADEWFTARSEEDQGAVIGTLCKLLETEKIAYDIKGYRDAPPGLRIWCGSTVQAADLEALMPWIDWAYHTVKAEEQRKAAA